MCWLPGNRSSQSIAISFLNAQLGYSHASINVSRQPGQRHCDYRLLRVLMQSYFFYLTHFFSFRSLHLLFCCSHGDVCTSIIARTLIGLMYYPAPSPDLDPDSDLDPDLHLDLDLDFDLDLDLEAD